MRDGKIILKKKKTRHKILFFMLFLAILFLIGYQIGICSVKQSLNSINTQATVYELLKRIQWSWCILKDTSFLANIL